MHDEIIRYSLEGELSDSNIAERKARLVEFIESQMRDQGVVPALDVDPQFTLNYNPEKGTYQFWLSAYGVFLGKEKDVWGIAGVMSGKTLFKHTPLSKLIP